uniref:Uncharacterized protein n=1 Tax=Tetradesmus obliquus TaxID=3088 RepID=A0A383VIA8_TETOB|eukprot:jgi/Sobl393_1/5478/SZX64404.1
MTLQVRRWGGSAWQSVRTNGLPSDNAFTNPNLVIDQKDTPWLAWLNSTTGDIKVFRYSLKASSPRARRASNIAGTWAAVSSESITSGKSDCGLGCTADPKFAVSGAGQPYVAYTNYVMNDDYRSSDKTTAYVKRLGGGKWATVRQFQGPASVKFSLELALGPSAPYAPFVMYKWEGDALKLPPGQQGPVLRQQGSAWTSIANASESVTFSPNMYTNIAMAGSAAEPYVAYSGDSAYGDARGKTVVATPRGGAWAPVASSNMPSCGIAKQRPGYNGNLWVRTRLVATRKALYLVCNQYDELNVYSLSLPARANQPWVGVGGMPTAVGAAVIDPPAVESSFEVQVAGNGKLYVAYLDAAAGGNITIAAL